MSSCSTVVTDVPNVVDVSPTSTLRADVTQTVVSPTDTPVADGDACPSGESDSPVQEMSLPLSPQIPPSDVLQQVLYYPLGGGEPYWAEFIEFHNESVNFRNFKPNQSLRVLVYQDTGEQVYIGGLSRYITEWYVQVDQNGDLELNVGKPSSDYTLFVLDAVTGDSIVATCPCGPPFASEGEGFQVGSTIVANTGDDNLNIRSGPGYDKQIIGKIPHGTEMTIIGMARTAEGERWWPILANTGLEGWITELWILPDNYLDLGIFALD